MAHAQAQFGLRGADLHHIYVAPPARRRGYGRALLAAAENMARDRGCTYLVIGAHPGNDGAKAVYLAAGYDWRTPSFWRFRKTL